MKLLIVILALACGACAAMKPAETPTVLRLSPNFPAQVSLAPGSITVGPVLAGGVIAERRLAYIDRASPHAIRQTATQFWDEPPPRLLEHALAAGLSARLSGVTGPEVAAISERRLVVRLARFEEETGGTEAPNAVVSFEATTVAAGGRSVLLTGRYCGTARIASTDPSGRAAAFEAAEKMAVDALADDLASGRSAPGHSTC
jgi:ABC-type uncharacterized transport system auxiliary subunit